MRLRKRRVEFFGVLGSKQVMIVALILVAVLFCLPILLLSGRPLYQRQSAAGGDGQESATLPIDRAAPVMASKDRGRVVRLQKTDGSVAELTMADYLWGVVAAEMPASFEPEALKAQACAARTYTVIKQNNASQKHPGADICADSSCCQAYVERTAAEIRWGLNAQTYGEKIDQAIQQTDGMGIRYQGQPIQALFFSSAAGKTVDAVEVWGNEVDYLKSVDSIEGDEVPNYRTQVAFGIEQVRQMVQQAYPDTVLSGDPAGWFGPANRTEGGAVSSILVGGVTLTGGQVRTLFSLRSATFTVSLVGEEVLFDVTGYGHGVGMSQYGANAMAKQGEDFQSILTWYYSGTQIEPLW